MDLDATFRNAMAGLAAGVAVVTARRSDAHPCGLVATSVSSFSATPPSLLVSVAHSSRCHDALTSGDAFGVHVLAAHQEIAVEYGDAGKLPTPPSSYDFPDGE